MKTIFGMWKKMKGDKRRQGIITAFNGLIIRLKWFKDSLINNEEYQKEIENIYRSYIAKIKEIKEDD